MALTIALPFSVAVAHAKPAKQPASLEDRRNALNALFTQFWDANMERNPEYASILGDRRFNDKVSDLSPRAFNAWIAREQEFLMRLAAIDPTGFTDLEKNSREMLLRDFAEDIESQDFKEWQMPINQMGGIYADFPELANQLPFTTVKDYDDWIARLRAMPDAFDQVISNMGSGIEAHRVPPKTLLEKTFEQVKILATQKPEDSPLAGPIKKFPTPSRLPSRLASRPKPSM